MKTLPKGFKNSEIGPVPKDWEVKELGEMFIQILGGGTPSRVKVEYWHGDLPWATVKDISNFSPIDTQEHISSDAVKGNCIHNIFAVYKVGDTDGNLQRTTQTLTKYGFPNALLKQKEKIIESIKWLYDYLTKTYGTPTRIERECPLLYNLPTGQMLRGEIDLLWYYRAENGNEKCILIDYKTFPGRRDQLEEHTKKYYPQLSAYHAALTSAGVAVTDTLIYYPVQAHIRRLI